MRAENLIHLRSFFFACVFAAVGFMQVYFFEVCQPVVWGWFSLFFSFQEVFCLRGGCSLFFPGFF